MSPAAGGQRAAASPESYLPSLDGWRALAILGVILAHGSMSFSASGATPKVAAAFDACGARGVDVFFGISGLLISYNLSREKALAGRVALGTFYARRACRLFPAAFVFLAVVAACGAAGLIPVLGGELAACVFVFRNYYTATVGTSVSHYTNHFWSLSVEEQFYLAFPLLVAAGGRRAVLVFLPAAALAVAGWRVAEVLWNPSAAVFPRLQVHAWRTDLCADGLIWGAWFGVLLATPAGKQRLAVLAHPAARWGLTGLFVVLVTVSVPAMRTWFTPTVPALLVSTILSPGSAHARLLELHSLRWVGKLSYSLYLWQQLFLVPAKIPAAERADGVLGTFQNFPLGLPAVFLAAAVSYYLVEQPLRRRGYRWLARRKGQT